MTKTPAFQNLGQILNPSQEHGEASSPLQIESAQQDPTGAETRRRDQFLVFLRWVQWTILPSALALIIGGYIKRLTELYIWGAATFGFFLIALVSTRLTHTKRINTGVYLIVGSILFGFVPLPLFISGLLPFFISAYIVAVILTGLFVSTRLILRTTIIAGIVFGLPALLEIWKPFSTWNASTLGALFAMGGLVSAGILVHFFGYNLRESLVILREYAKELEHSQAELLSHARALETTAADLDAQRVELEEANRQLKVAAQRGERRAAMLQASAEVSRAIVQIHDVGQLLPKVTQLISQHFDFYHAGIFLIDQPSGYAVLRAASSAGGQRMLARRHKLRVGSEGIVGYVTGTGRPRIALDVGTDAYYFDNPDMPDTRSEMALPLYAGDQIVGALDIQSTQAAAFDQEDVTMLATLADQIATALQNARFFQQTQAALAEAEETHRRFLRQEWDSFLGGQPTKQPTDQFGTTSLARQADGV